LKRALLLALALACAPARAAEPLPALGADTREVTASGLSSGGFMAVQLHVAYSSIVKGVGVIAGGPYYCAEDSAWFAYFNCRRPGLFSSLPPTARLRAEVEREAKAGRVDPPARLAGSQAWLFTSPKDNVVSPAVVEALNAFYASYKVDTTIVRDFPAGHGIPALDSGITDCTATRAPFVNDCGYDAAGEILKKVLGAPALPGLGLRGRLVSFDQKEFARPDPSAISMDEEGFVYIPTVCETETCQVHVALHGCAQSAADVGDAFARLAGYNRWADANRLIVLYPQATPRSGLGLGTWSWVWNPSGCWDWWGYTGPLYHTKEGPQIRAIKAMIDRLAAPRRAR